MTQPAVKRIRIGLAIAAATSLCAIATLLYLVIDTQSVSENLTTAQIAIDEGRSYDAIKSLAKVVSEDPNHAGAHRMLARLARENGRFLEAAGFWARVRVLDPTDNEALGAEALNLLAVGRWRAVTQLLTMAEEPTGNVEERVLLARAHIQGGELKKARSILSEIATRWPKNAQGQLLRAEIYFASGDYTKAEQAFRVAEKHKSVQGGALIGLGNCALRKDQTHQAKQYFLKAYGIRDHCFQAGRILAEHYRRMGEDENAKAIWEQLREQYPNSPEVLVPLAEFCLLANDSTGLKKHADALSQSAFDAVQARHYLTGLLNAIQGSPNQCLKYLNWSEEFSGKRGLHRLIRLQCLIQVQQYDTIPAAALEIGNIPQHRDQVVNLLLQAAQTAWQNNEIKAAVNLGKTAQQIDGDNPRAQLLIAYGELLESNYQKALERVNSLMGDEQELAALELRGRLLLEMKNYALAAVDFRQIVKENPDSHIGHFQLGQALFLSGQTKPGIESLEKAQKLQPNNVEITVRLYEALVECGNVDAARSLSNRLTQFDKPSVRSLGHALSAGLSVRSQKQNEAIEAYNRAIAETPSRIPYYLAASDLLMDQKRYEEANLTLEQAKTRARDNKYVLFKYALCADRAGKRNEAIVRYRNLINQYPDWAIARLNLSQLLATDENSRKESLALAEEARKLAPKWWATYLNLGNRFKELDQIEEARDAFITGTTLTQLDDKARQQLQTALTSLTP